jgi:hypothetical protein
VEGEFGVGIRTAGRKGLVFWRSIFFLEQVFSRQPVVKQMGSGHGPCHHPYLRVVARALAVKVVEDDHIGRDVGRWHVLAVAHDVDVGEKCLREEICPVSGAVFAGDDEDAVVDAAKRVNLELAEGQRSWLRLW